MRVKEARDIGREWLLEKGSDLSGFCGAFFHGSINWVSENDKFPKNSDLDIMIVLGEPDIPQKIGKFMYKGVLLEVSYIAREKLQPPKSVLINPYLAGSFWQPGIIKDPSRELTKLHKFISKKFAQKKYVIKRCEYVESKIKNNFKLKKVLIKYNHRDFHKKLLEMIGCSQIARECVENHMEKQDALKAYGICLRTAKKLNGGIVLPPNYYGRPGFSSYVGTLTFSEECMYKLFMELFEQLKKAGAKVIVVLTGHYGECQVDFIKKVSDDYVEKNYDIKIIAQPEYEGVTVNGEVPADHAGKWETSMFWYMYPELTHMDKFSMETMKKKIYPDPPHNVYNETEDWEWEEDLSKTASPELGKKCIEIISDHLVNKIENLL